MKTKDNDFIQCVIDNFPHMTSSEISARFGYERSRVVRTAKALGIQHTEETLQRITEKRRESIRKARESTDYVKKGRRLKALRRYDEKRLWQGLPRLTRFRFRTMPLRAYKSRWWLCRNNGYTFSPDSPYVLVYDEHTRRSPNEKMFTSRYGFTFQPFQP